MAGLILALLLQSDIERLDAEDPRERDAAQARLFEKGRAVEARLRAALAGAGPEARERIRQILEAWDWQEAERKLDARLSDRTGWERLQHHAVTRRLPNVRIYQKQGRTVALYRDGRITESILDLFKDKRLPDRDARFDVCRVYSLIARGEEGVFITEDGRWFYSDNIVLQFDGAGDVLTCGYILCSKMD